MEIFNSNINLLFITRIDLLIVGITVAATGVFGSTLYFNNRKSITNVTFFLFTIVTMFWGVFNYLNYQINSPEIILWLLRFVMFFAVWQAFLIFQLCLVIPNEKYNFNKYYKLLLLPLVIITSIITLTPLIWSKIVEQSNVGFVSNPDRGPGLLIFGIVAVGLVVSGLFVLIRRIRQLNGPQKVPLKLVLWGSLITFVLIITFNFLLPVIFNIRSFVPYGSLFMFPMVVFISYAIIKHKLFNVRVAGTALLVFSLSIVSFIEVTQTDDLVFIIYRSSVLFFILVFGILLIRGVIREVKQREEIAKMAEDIRRAYAIEKKAKEDINRAYIIERRAKEELEKLDKVKDQFLAQTQHDLRTPLTSIMGYLDLLLNGTFGRQNKKTVEVIKKINDVSKNMVRKINDFLDTSAIQLGKNPVSLKPGIQINSILDEIESELEFKASSKNIYLKLEPFDQAQGKKQKDLVISADRERLKGALFNIIDNSIKFTVKGGVTVNFKEENGKVLIKIQDTGIGIPKEKIKTMFETQFERTEQAQKTATGSGIGLYLSTQIIKYHNGKVWAESEGEGKGSTFYIELPVD